MGFFYSIVSSAAFGLIPLFTLPLMKLGVSGATALFYRFAIATVVLGIVLAMRGERFRARGIDLCKLAGMSFMYTMAALLFFWGFKHMPSGVVATIQFTYPVMVMLIMNVGRMLSIGYEKVLLMYTPSNSGVSDIIDTLVYRTGLQNQNYSYATAIGLFGGIIGLILVSGSNAISKKLTDESLY